MSGKDLRQDRESPPRVAAEGDLSGRLERLGTELEARRPAPRPGSGRGSSASNPAALAGALRASSEFVAGVMVGGGLGWAFDKGLGTSPWGLIVFLLLGFAAGVYNVLRSAAATAPAGATERRDGA